MLNAYGVALEVTSELLSKIHVKIILYMVPGQVPHLPLGAKMYLLEVILVMRLQPLGVIYLMALLLIILIRRVGICLCYVSKS